LAQVILFQSHAVGLPADQPVPLSEFVRPIRKHWLAVTAAAVIGLALALVATRILPPVYEAKAWIEIQGFNSDFLNTRAVDPTAADPEVGAYMQTQMKYMENGPLLERVADRLGAEKRPEFQSKGAGRQRILERVADGLRVRALGTSRIVEISYSSRDPKFAAAFANTLASEFINYSVNTRIESSRTVADRLGDQLIELKQELDHSQKVLQDYTRDAGLVFTSEHDSAEEGRLKHMQEALSKAQEERVAEQTRYERALATPADALPEVLDDATLRTYQVKLTELRQQAADLSAVLKPTHYKVQQVQAQIQTLESAIQTQRANILARLKTQFDAASNRENMLAQYYRQQTGLVSGQAAKTVRYDVLKGQVETARQLFEAMSQRAREAGIASAVRAPNIRLVAPAEVPEVPARPQPLIYSLVGLSGGILAGMVYACTRQGGSAATLKSLDVPECPSAPQLTDRPDARTPLSPISADLTCWQDPYSQMAEGFHEAAASVLFSEPAVNRRVIAVTSSGETNEGTSREAANLAIMAAAAGQRVLLIDANLRLQSLHRIFGMAGTRSLFDLLRADPGERQYLPFECGSWTSVPGLTLLSGGAAPADAESLVDSARLRRWMDLLRHMFDVIVIDTPSMHQPEARMFGRLSDGVVLVIKAGSAGTAADASALVRLAEDGTQVLGTIPGRWNSGETV
jgi:polysaccharide biosynthesis transport protein